MYAFMLMYLWRLEPHPAGHSCDPQDCCCLGESGPGEGRTDQGLHARGGGR